MEQQMTPSAMYRPDLALVTKEFGEDKVTKIEQWHARYGDVNAFGWSPEEAMANFDIQWTARVVND